MDYKVVVMPHGRFEGLRGRLLTEPTDSEYQTPIETFSFRFYPDDVLWAYGATKAAKNALKKAGFAVRNNLGNVVWINLI